VTKEDLVIRQTVRFPKEVHEAIEAARGAPGKPKASFNDTLLYLVREGLKATGQAVKETEPGNWVPELLAAA
jgi:hypothetical protein